TRQELLVQKVAARQFLTSREEEQQRNILNRGRSEEDLRAELAHERDKLASITAEFGRVDSRHSASAATWERLAKLIGNNLEPYLAQVGSAKLIEYDGPIETTKRNESPAAALVRITSKREELEAKMKAVRRAPRTGEAVKAIARAGIEALAQKG